MLGKAASIMRPKTSDKCNSPTPTKPPMLMIVWGSVFAGVLAWLTVTVMKLQRQLMILEGLIATRKNNDPRRPGVGPPAKQTPPSVESAIGKMFGRRPPTASRQPPNRQPPPPTPSKRPAQRPVRNLDPPSQPPPMPPQNSLDEIDDEDEIHSDDERVQELPENMQTIEEEDDDEEAPN